MAEQRKSLTRTIVEKTRPDPERDVFVWDTKVPGFGVRIYPSGSRKYLFQYRVSPHQQRRKTLGVHGPLTPEKARAMASDLYEVVRKGGDPVREQQLAARRKPDTIDNVVDEFVEKYLKQQQRAQSYIDDTRALFDNHVLPRWRSRDIKSITRRDVIELLDALVAEDKPITANRALAAVRKLFNWALQRDVVEINPATLVQKPSQETVRERALSPDEVPVLWQRFGALGYPFGPFFKMVLATGQRRDEVASMRWQDIDAKERTWTLPSEMTKAGRTHVVPLSPLAMEILSRAKTELRRLIEAKEDKTEEAHLGACVFTTTGDRPISGYSKVKERLDHAVAAALAKDGRQPLEPWTIHDLRRTVATSLGRLGVPRFIIARVLNHADRSVTGIYDKYEYLNEKQHALDAWGQFLGNLIAAPDANVVPIRAPAR